MKVTPLSLVAALVLLASAVAPAAYAKEWKSGEIVSRDTFNFGAFEARLKAAKGDAAITGFLIITPDAGNTRPWQEMAFEFFGKSGTTYQTQIITPGEEYDPTAHLPRAQHIQEYTSSPNYFDNFHTARMEWTPDALRFIYDGNLVREETDKSKFAHLMDPSKAQPMEIRATLWAGFSDWSGHLDSSNPPNMATFDYIKYEKWDNGKFTPEWTDNFDSYDSSRWQQGDWTFPFAVNDFNPSNIQYDGNMVVKFTH